MDQCDDDSGKQAEEPTENAEQHSSPIFPRMEPVHSVWIKVEPGSSEVCEEGVENVCETANTPEVIPHQDMHPASPATHSPELQTQVFCKTEHYETPEIKFIASVSSTDSDELAAKSTESDVLQPQVVYDVAPTDSGSAGSHMDQELNVISGHTDSQKHGATSPQQSNGEPSEDKQSGPPFQCDLCPKTFNCKQNLCRHFYTHTGRRPYECQMCLKSFTRKSHLVTHIRSHTGELPFTCDICSRRFIEKSQLKSHLRKHTGERPYKCESCGRSFTKNCHLTAHRRIHSGEQPFSCDICNRRFTERTHVVRHMRSHTGERPFDCGLCFKSFSDVGSRARHMKTHTGGNPLGYRQC